MRGHSFRSHGHAPLRMSQNLSVRRSTRGWRFTKTCWNLEFKAESWWDYNNRYHVMAFGLTHSEGRTLSATKSGWAKPSGFRNFRHFYSQFPSWISSKETCQNFIKRVEIRAVEKKKAPGVCSKLGTRDQGVFMGFILWYPVCYSVLLWIFIDDRWWLYDFIID